MKSVWIAMLSLVLLACQGNTQEKVEMKTQRDTISYSIGTDIGKNLKAQSIDVNPAILAAGLKDAIGGGKTMLTEKEIQDAMMAFQHGLAAKQMEKAKEMGDKNKKESEAFLAANKTKDGVKTTASGLQYKIVKESPGPKPKADQTVTVNYKGTLVDGTEFQNSYKSGQPATFGLNQVIKGWAEGLQLMPVGSKYIFYIPSELGWMEQGAGQAVPPNACVIFEVDLLSVK